MSSVVKEFTILEERFKTVQKQLIEEIQYKKHYKNQVLKVNHEKQELLKEIETLKLKNSLSNNSNEINEKDEFIKSLRRENEYAQREIKILKQQKLSDLHVKRSEIANKDFVIENQQNQIEMDDTIKRDLNDCLEQAYAEIKSLNENKNKRPTKDKSTNTNENAPSANHQEKELPHGPIDLSLPTRKRADEQENRPKERTSNSLPFPVGLILDKDQLPVQILSNHENQINERNPNYVKRIDHTNGAEMNQVENHVFQVTSNNNLNRELNSRPVENPVQITLDSRFTVHRLRNKSLKNTNHDVYDFAQKDNPKLRTKNRPICKWYLKNKCHSDVCIYQHPERKPASSDSISLEDISDTELTDRPREICRYHLQGRCWFGHNCKNLHIDNEY